MKEIRRIISAYDALDQSQYKVALASVVNVEESSYRRIGARMLVQDNGIWTGGISGGCIEGDALKHSKKAIALNRSSKVIYNTLEDDQHQIGVGLGCNGKIEVLFTPIDANDRNNPIEQLRKITESNKAAILITVINSENPDQILGMSHWIEDGGSSLEFCNIPQTTLKSIVEEVKLKRSNRIESFTTSEDEQLQVLFEFVRPETKLVIVGDNYDVNAMVGLAAELGWQITVVGKLSKLSTYVSQIAHSLLPLEKLKEIAFDEYTALILMTHDYNIDKDNLPVLLKSKLGYLGVLGPKKRWHKLRKELSLPNAEEMLHFYTPAGLDIGAESPEEIALAILSEIVAVFRQRSSGFLKNRVGTIHPR